MSRITEINQIYSALQTAKANANRTLSRRCSMDDYDEARNDLRVIQDGLDALESLSRAN